METLYLALEKLSNMRRAKHRNRLPGKTVKSISLDFLRIGSRHVLSDSVITVVIITPYASVVCFITKNPRVQLPSK